MEVHFVPRESIPSDKPTDEMVNDADDSQVHVRLTYDLKALPKYRGNRGESQVLHFSKRRSFQDFFVHLGDFVAAKLAIDEPESYSHLRSPDLRYGVLLRPVLHHPCPVRRRALAFDDSGKARVSTLGDLLGDVNGADNADTPDGKPQLHIRLELVNLFPRKDPADPMIVIRHGAVALDSGGLPEVHHIGHKPRTSGRNISVKTSETYFWHRSSPKINIKLVKAST